MAEKQQKKAWKAPKQGHLAQALEGWSNISQTVKLEKPIPPDEKILNDIKGLLSELKFKLDELSFIPSERTASPPKSEGKNLETQKGSGIETEIDNEIG